jgi:hypothetical protein
MDELGSLGKTLDGEERTTVVDQKRFVAEFCPQSDERGGVVARSANDQTTRRPQHLDHHPMAVDLGDPIPSFLQGTLRNLGVRSGGRRGDEGALADPIAEVMHYDQRTLGPP